MSDNIYSKTAFLDNEPAKIRKASQGFVYVYRKDGKGGDVEFSIKACEQVFLCTNGYFKS
jgi:hypothetical protein